MPLWHASTSSMYPKICSWRILPMVATSECYSHNYATEMTLHISYLSKSAFSCRFRFHMAPFRSFTLQNLQRSGHTVVIKHSHQGTEATEIHLKAAASLQALGEKGTHICSLVSCSNFLFSQYRLSFFFFICLQKELPSLCHAAPTGPAQTWKHSTHMKIFNIVYFNIAFILKWQRRTFM